MIPSPRTTMSPVADEDRRRPASKRHDPLAKPVQLRHLSIIPGGAPGPAEGHQRASEPVDDMVELFCAMGCKAVYQVIAQLQGGSLPDRMRHLNQRDCARVLTELQSIMDVYAENGSVCLSGGQD